jgi:hypothetical protein
VSRDIENTVDEFCTHWQGLPRAEGVLVPHLKAFQNNVKAALQPYVALVDINSGDHWALRVFGTGRLNSFGRDVTKINPLEIYTPNLRPSITEKVLSVLSHPCGLKTTHRLRTVKGLDHIQYGVTLPLVTDDGQPECIVNFVVSNEPLAHDDRQGTVEEIIASEWMDIGAGAPNI